MTAHAHHSSFHGPKCWALTGILGIAAGIALAFALPPHSLGGHPVVPVWLVAPFAVLLASIAMMPFISARIWHHHFPDFAFLLGGLITGYYLAGYRDPDPHHPALAYGQAQLLHSFQEYYAFIALVGGLFVVSGGILVDVRGRGSPLLNTFILAAGAVLANVVGTTGASMLLVRPFMRINRGRLRPIHIVMFIFIVSNCGGCLTPIGDPPLYLGYLKGIPFLWTLENLLTHWALVNGLLLIVFFLLDLGIQRTHKSTFAPLPSTQEAGNLMEAEVHADRPSLRLRGTAGLICLALMIGGVFIDPLLKKFAGIEGFPIGATFQIAVAVAAYRLAPKEILSGNDFNFGPVKEVGLLFLGIFITMTPALAYLASHGHSLGIEGSTPFHFGTGALSAVLDNAPTYANFLQVAFGDTEISPATITEFLATPSGPATLAAISTGAVFFGAMTYIGNGPNFMVKAIAEASGLRMPSFFGFLMLACLFLLPILIIHWLVLIR